MDLSAGSLPRPLILSLLVFRRMIIGFVRFAKRKYVQPPERS